MKRAAQILVFILGTSGLFLFFSLQRNVPMQQLANTEMQLNADLEPINVDLPNQPRLAMPPTPIKAIYATGWSAGSEKKTAYLIDLIKKTELNAIVIDIKDYSGNLSYRTGLELPKKYGAEREIKIEK